MIQTYYILDQKTHRKVSISFVREADALTHIDRLHGAAPDMGLEIATHQTRVMKQQYIQEGMVSDQHVRADINGLRWNDKNELVGICDLGLATKFACRYDETRTIWEITGQQAPTQSHHSRHHRRRHHAPATA